MKAKLIVVGGDAKAAEINLNLPAILGRGREANLTLPHPLVSRQHCEIFEQDGRLAVRDMGSLNGTFVNNQKIEEPTILPSGDLLTVGAVTFRAVYTDASLSGIAKGNTPNDQTVGISDNTVTQFGGDDEEVEFEFDDATEAADDDFDVVDEVAGEGSVVGSGIELVDDDWDEDFFEDDESDDSDSKPNLNQPNPQPSAAGSTEDDDDEDLSKFFEDLD